MDRFSVKAVFIGVLVGYVLPIALFKVLGYGLLQLNIQALSSLFAMLVVAWMIIFAPLTAGYLAAKNSPELPLYHGLAAVTISMVTLLLISAIGPPWMVPVVLIVSIVLGVVGARRFKLEKA